MTQILVNALLAASIYTLVGLGFGLAYQTMGFLNFAHGVFITFAAYGLYLFKTVFNLSWPLSLPLAVACSIIFSLMFYFCIIQPLRQRGSSPLVILVASLGTYVVAQNTISMIFGDRIQTVQTGPVIEGAMILGARLTTMQVYTLLATVICFVVTYFILRFTKNGLLIRAYSANPTLAETAGISANKILLLASVLSASLAGVAGIALAVDIGITPSMGMRPFMMGVVAVIVGGARNVVGILLGALLLGLVQNFGLVFCDSQWQDAIAFIVLLLFLLVRPQGFFGKKIRKAEV
ncbi:MAG: branched-chain amino acid ABC transporter permease [Geobacteraceae bacterium]